MEMGASTSKFRKSKLGAKLNMKHVASEVGFPQSLVTLRHQAVHESKNGQMHSRAMLKHAFNEIQTFLQTAYWDVIHFRLEKRSR